MDKDKIIRLCNDIEDIATGIRERTMKDSYFMTQTIINKVREISTEISEPPKTNGDIIRQMTDDELAELIAERQICDTCCIKLTRCLTGANCKGGVLGWIKQEVG